MLSEKSEGLSYRLEASAGYEFLSGPDDTAIACMKRVDEKLYQDKKNKK